MNKNMPLSKKKNLTNIYYLLLYLFTYAFLGWLLETCYAYCELGTFVKRGFLYGPICPIYGWGALIIIQFLGKYQKHSLKLFFGSIIIFSAFEYIVGFCLDALFAAKWWDYTEEFLNLNGRISILFSFVWGIIGLIFVNHIHPFVKSTLHKILEKFPYWFKLHLIRILTIIFIVDTVFSCIKNFKLLS